MSHCKQTCWGKGVEGQNVGEDVLKVNSECLWQYLFLRPGRNLPPLAFVRTDQSHPSAKGNSQWSGQNSVFTKELASEWPSQPLWQRTPRLYMFILCDPAFPFLGISPRDIILTLKKNPKKPFGSMAKKTVGRGMVCGKCEKEQGTVITPETCFPRC